MEDVNIIELYFKRDTTAIKESRKKYGSYCSCIANNILHSFEDTEECVNDTWFRAWNNMPPEKPNRLALFFGRITRNLAIDRFRRNKSQKNGGGLTGICIYELDECIGDGSPVEDRLALKELINSFLSEINENNREIFLLRYWYMMPIAEIAECCDMTEGAVKMVLQRVRAKLRDHLDKEGVGV